MVFGGFMKNKMTTLFEHTFTEYIHWELTENTIHQLFVETTIETAQMVAPVMATGAIAGIAAYLLQICFLFATESMKFDLKHVDPIQGAKNIFSIRALVELLKSLLKIAFIGTVIFTVIWIYKDDMMMLAFKNIDVALAFFGEVTM